MEKLVIEGGGRLKGSVRVSGSKNAALPLLAATLLSEEASTIRNVPQLRDVATMCGILRALGCQVEVGDRQVTVRPTRSRRSRAPYHLVRTMRASICVLGPLLAKRGLGEVSLPGGCVIGPRPVGLHLKGLQALGASLKITGGYLVGSAPRLRGTTVYLGGSFGSSVLATANVMMAATLARGRTRIENAACEPELVDLGDCLVRMGARIRGHGTPIVEIEGVDSLRGAFHTLIPDRIEAGTYLIAAAATRGDLLVENAVADHLGAVIDKLREAGVTVTGHPQGLHVRMRTRTRPVDVTTLPYPGFPTDLQAQMMALMTMSRGISVITEKIFPDRFLHVSELARMGAQITLEGTSAVVKGIHALSGAPVMASDLRASAALVVAGLIARGRTEVLRVYHLDRGYERLEQKLRRLGAAVKRQEE